MAKAEKTERLVVQMEPKLKADLERYSEETGVPISEFVRRTLVEALNEFKGLRTKAK